jgi:hypothetical protein
VDCVLVVLRVSVMVLVLEGSTEGDTVEERDGESDAVAEVVSE